VLLSKLFSFAESIELRTPGTNPCKGIKRYRENARDRYPSIEELKRLSETLGEFERDGGNPYAAAAIRLLVLTGARLSEVLSLQWAHVDLERGVAVLPDSKTGRKPVYLGPEATALLNDLPRIEGNPYVLPGSGEKGHLVNLQKPWRKVRKAAGTDDVRLHDLRNSFASVAAGHGASLPMIGAMLGHGSPATTHRYAHLRPDAHGQCPSAIWLI